MALRLFDGFDHYDGEHVGSKWDSVVQPAGPISGGRNSPRKLYLYGTGSVTKILDNKYTWVSGFDFDYADGSILDLPFLQFLDEDTAQVSFKMSPGIDRKIHVYCGSTYLGDSGAIEAPGVWSHLEFKVTFDSMMGWIEIRKSGIPIFQYMGNTIVTANNYANRLNLHGLENATYFDNLYACDIAGSDNNDFLGDWQVTCLLPESNGDTNDWSPSAGDNYQCVNDDSVSHPDDDETFVKALAADQVDLYEYPAVLTGSFGKILGVQPLPYIKKIDSEARTFKTITKTHSANHEGAAQELDEEYRYYPEIQEVNPATGLPWTVDEINSAQFGIKAES